MTMDIHTYSHDLTAVTAEKERLETELDVAEHIPSGMLPTDTLGMRELKRSPSLEAMAEITDFVEQSLVDAGLPGKLIAQMNIIVDEIYSNILHYSCATDSTVGVKISGGCVTLRFSDNGLPYNPTEKASPNITLSAEEREIGGLGLSIVKKFMDTVKYEHCDGLNSLTVTKQTD